MAKRLLTDDEIADRLARASGVLGEEAAETARGNTVLAVARRAVSVLMLGLEMAADDETDEVPGVIRSPEPEPGTGNPDL